jgi:hypothetical protein
MNLIQLCKYYFIKYRVGYLLIDSSGINWIIYNFTYTNRKKNNKIKIKNKFN